MSGSPSVGPDAVENKKFSFFPEENRNFIPRLSARSRSLYTGWTYLSWVISKTSWHVISSPVVPCSLTIKSSALLHTSIVQSELALDFCTFTSVKPYSTW